MTIWCTAVACERRTGCGSGVVLMKSHFPNNLVKVDRYGLPFPILEPMDFECVAQPSMETVIHKGCS